LAEIDFTYVERTGVSTHTGDSAWTDIAEDTGGAVAEITSGNFVTGGVYLLMFSSWTEGDDNAQVFGIRALHGSTAFTGSDYVFEPRASGNHYKYFWFTQWTAVASEGVKLQHQNTSSTTTTVKADTVTLTAIRLDADLTPNVDYHFAEDTDSRVLGTGFSTLDNAAITIDSGDHDTNDLHVIMAVSRMTSPSTGSQTESAIRRTGEATEDRPLVSTEGEDAAEERVHHMILAHQLGASSNTFTQASRIESGGSATRTYSAIFALNLNKFTAQDSAYTEAEVALGTTNFATNLQTLSFDLSGEAAARNCMILGYAIGDYQTNSDTTSVIIQSALQVATVDQPPGQTADTRHIRPHDVTDEIEHSIVTQENLSVASHTIDLVGSVNNTATAAAAEDRLIVAFTLELAAAAAARTLFSGPIPQPMI